MSTGCAASARTQPGCTPCLSALTLCFVAQAKARAKLADLGKSNPQLVADMKAKLASMESKIVPTVTEARDPKNCSYTEEGSVAHDLLKETLKMERIAAHMADLEVKLSAADKEQYKEQILSRVASLNAIFAKVGEGVYEGGGGHWVMDANEVLKNSKIPDSIKLGNLSQVLAGKNA